MIYGYIIISRSGIPIRYKIFSGSEVSKDKISYLASAVVAISDFFKSMLGIEPESILGGDYKMYIAMREEIVFIVISDKADSIAESVANKYADMISEVIAKENIDLSFLVEEEISKVLKPVLDDLDNTIVKLNKSVESITYLK